MYFFILQGELPNTRLSIANNYVIEKFGNSTPYSVQYPLKKREEKV